MRSPVDAGFHVHPDHGLAFKREAAVKGGLCEQQGQPVAVVLPHAGIGDLGYGRPDRHCLIGLAGSAVMIIRPIDMAEDVRAVGHGKPQLTELARSGGSDEKFFLGFPDHGLQRRLTRIDFSAGTIDFSRAETALFFDEEDLAVLHDEHERGVNLTLP